MQPHPFVSFEQTLDYLYSRLPFFTRDGKAAIKNSLDNILSFCDELGQPQTNYPCIHIAGTNGKGSTSHSIASVLQTHGFKTGLYTSPHLLDFRERIRVNGGMANKQFVVDFVNKHRSLIENINPSFFEITLAMAFEYFAKEKVDVAVIEVGLGGRLDSTNIIHPLVSVITNISYDHQDLLGDTLPQIAAEKAGIIKDNTPVVLGRNQEEILHVFESKANQHKAPITKAWENKIPDAIDFELKGIYQHENLKTIYTTCQVLQEIGFLKLNPILLKDALANVSKYTGLRGRWEVLYDKGPKVIADTGHNEDGLQQVVSQLKSEKYQVLHFVIGMMNDKKRDKLWQILPKEASYYFCKPNVPRGLNESILQEEAKENGFEGMAYASCEKAVEAALANASIHDIVFIGASTFVVAETIDCEVIRKLKNGK